MTVEPFDLSENSTEREGNFLGDSGKSLSGLVKGQVRMSWGFFMRIDLFKAVFSVFVFVSAIACSSKNDDKKEEAAPGPVQVDQEAVEKQKRSEVQMRTVKFILALSDLNVSSAWTLLNAGIDVNMIAKADTVYEHAGEKITFPVHYAYPKRLDEMTPLLKAVICSFHSSECLKVVDRLIELGADPTTELINSEDYLRKDKESALRCAVRTPFIMNQKHFRTLESLLNSQKIDRNNVEQNHELLYEAFQEFALYGDEREGHDSKSRVLLLYLTEWKFKFDPTLAVNADKPLLGTIVGSNPSFNWTLQMLLTMGYSPNLMSSNGYTPLMLAVLGLVRFPDNFMNTFNFGLKKESSIQILLENGADPNVRNVHGKTALDYLDEPYQGSGASQAPKVVKDARKLLLQFGAQESASQKHKK